MAELNVQFVRPDRALFQGPVASLVLVTYAGELGVYPGHAAEIVALGNGVVRMKKLPQDGGGEEDVVVSGATPRSRMTRSSCWRTTPVAPTTSTPTLSVAPATRPSRPARRVTRVITAALTTITRSTGVTFC